MAYYGGTGDYYRGDYYRGDPFLGGLIKTIAGPLLKKGARWIGRLAGSKAARTGANVLGTGAIIKMALPGQPPPLGQVPVPGMKGKLQRFLPGGATGYEQVKRRRMNPTNPKALRRALRRVSGFAKLSQRTKRDIGKAATAAGVRGGRRAFRPRGKVC